MIRLEDEEIRDELHIPPEDRHLRVSMGEVNSFKQGNEAQLKKVYDWGNEVCPHSIKLIDGKASNFLKRECPDCWQALLEETK